MTYSIRNVSVCVGGFDYNIPQEAFQAMPLSVGPDPIFAAKIARVQEVRGLAKALLSEDVRVIPMTFSQPGRDWVFRENNIFNEQQAGGFSLGCAFQFSGKHMITVNTFPKGMGLSVDEILGMVTQAWGVSACHFMPADPTGFSIENCLLPLPEVGLLVVDESYFENHRQEVYDLANTLELEIAPVPNSIATLKLNDVDMPLQTFPTGSQTILDDTGRLLVFTAKPDGESPLVDVLKDKNAKVIQVPFTRHLLTVEGHTPGSIRTKTNFMRINQPQQFSESQLGRMLF